MVQFSIKTKKGRALRLSRASLLALARQAFDQRFEGHLPKVFTAPGTHGHQLRRLFLVAHDNLVRQLLHAMFAYFIANFFVPQIRFSAYLRLTQFFRNLRRVVSLVFRDIHHHRLHR